ncbi:hypothetical protein GQ53DRAFT_388965 [Thozetella sp. PMI_491]|nr:hypothetical protein GQ53DRAFT_388965 [Thozetella sp. PMI_491]
MLLLLCHKVFVKVFVVISMIAATSTAASLSISTTGVARTFRVFANVLAHDLTPSIQGLELGYTAVDDCVSNLIFVYPRSGAVFSTDGNRIGVPHYSTDHNVSASILVKGGGTATVSSGIPTDLVCQGGTMGARDVLFSLERWMACPGDDGVFLSYRDIGQRTVAGCADVQLAPRCNRSQDSIEGAIDFPCIA